MTHDGRPSVNFVNFGVKGCSVRAAASMAPKKRKRKAVVALDMNLLTCPICLQAMKNPVAILCGHNACRSCLQKSMRRDPLCMTCRAPISSGIGDLRVNIVLKDIISASMGEDYHESNAMSLRDDSHSRTTTQSDFIRHSVEAYPEKRGAFYTNTYEGNAVKSSLQHSSPSQQQHSQLMVRCMGLV